MRELILLHFGFSQVQKVVFPALIIALLFLVGCGASSRFDLGIPASKSESFFFHMKSAALEYGYDASVNNEKQTLRIGTNSGRLVYQTNRHGDGLEVILSSKVHQNNKEMEERWLRNLEKSHDKILSRARVLSKANQAW